MAADFLDALRPLFDCLTDGICVTDAEGRVLYANDALGRLLGADASAEGEGSVITVRLPRDAAAEGAS